MIIERSLIAAQFATRGLLERGYGPQLRWVSGVRPDPLPWPEDLIVFFEGTRATKSPRVVNASGVTDRIIRDHEIMGHDNDLVERMRFR
jgi:hypothetical protein